MTRPDRPPLPGRGRGPALTPRQRRLADLGGALLRQAAGRDVPLAVTPLPEDDAVVVAHVARGGGRVYVAADGSVLFAGSAAPPHQALEVFRSGRRTPPEHFRPAPRYGDGA